MLAGIGAAAVTAAGLTARPARAVPDAAMVTVPPPNGTDDTAAIMSAIATAGVGGSLGFQAGTYRLSATVRPAAGQVWTGAGLDETTLKAIQTAEVMINSRGAFSVSDITLDLNKAALPTPSNPVLKTAIVSRSDATGAADLNVVRCRIMDAYGKGIDLAPSTGTPAGKVRVVDSTIENCGSDGIHIHRCADTEIRRCTTTACYNGVWIARSLNAVVDALTTEHNAWHGAMVAYSQQWSIANSVARYNVKWGITAGGFFEDVPVSVPNRYFTISGNTSTDNGRGGITLDPTVAQATDQTQPQDAEVLHNTCSNAGEPTSVHGINITHCRGVTVRGNVCHDNPNTGVQISSSAYVTAEANECMRNNYGLRVSPGSVVDGGHHTIGENNLHDNRIADLVLP